MQATKSIVENAGNSNQHTTLVSAIEAAGLVETLQKKGPFTLFAPVDAAFENLAEGTVEGLLVPEAKKTLTAVLTYHIVSGTYDFNALKSLVQKNNGKASLKTVGGGILSFLMNGEHNIMVMDESGASANVNVYDVYQSNSVIHPIDAVLMPKL